jgi:hypothetical protein
MSQPIDPTGEALHPPQRSLPIDRIEAALAQLGAEHAPPPGWQARVLAAVATPPRRLWWRYAGPALAFAAAAVLVLWLIAAPRPSPAIALDIRFERGAVVRGDERVVGDVARVRVWGGNRFRVIRIYRDDVHLVVRCPDDPACQASSDAMAVEFRLPEVGTYTIIALTAAAPLPALPGSYDGDSALAMLAGVSDIQRRTLNVH